MLSNLSAPADYFISDAGALPKLPAAMVSAGLTAAACSLSYSGRAVKACAASACPTASHRQPTAGKSAAPALAQFLAPHRGAIQESSDTSGRSHYRHRFCHLGAGTGAGNFSPTATALRLIRKKAAAYPRERAVAISAAHLPGLQLLRRLQPYLSYQGADPYRAGRRKTAPVSAGALYQLSALPSYLYAAGPTVGGFYAAAAIFANAAAFGPQRRKNLQQLPAQLLSVAADGRWAMCLLSAYRLTELVRHLTKRRPLAKRAVVCIGAYADNSPFCSLYGRLRIPTDTKQFPK